MRYMIFIGYKAVISITHLAHIIFSGLYNLRNGKKRCFKGENGTFKIYVVDGRLYFKTSFCINLVNYCH